MSCCLDSILLKRDASVQKRWMAMTNDELAAQLNSELRLEGRQAVTANVIRQWVSWGVLPKSIPKGQRVGSGPIWERDAIALYRAKRLASVRQWNVIRETAVISQAFLEWGHDDIKRVRQALLSEFSRSRRSLFKSMTSSTDFAAVANLSAAKKKALIHQSGQLDIMFVKDRAANWPDLLISFLGLAHSGSGDIGALPEILLQSGIFPEATRPLASTMITPSVVAAIQKLFADPDEHGVAGEIHLSNATDAELLEAREKTSHWLFITMPTILNFSIPKVLELPVELNEEAHTFDIIQQQLTKIYPQISSGHWATSAYVVALSMLRNQSINSL